MERVTGNKEEMASSTNSYGTTLRFLMVKNESSVTGFFVRRAFGMTIMIVERFGWAASKGRPTWSQFCCARLLL